MLLLGLGFDESWNQTDDDRLTFWRGIVLSDTFADGFCKLPLWGGPQGAEREELALAAESAYRELYDPTATPVAIGLVREVRSPLLQIRALRLFPADTIEAAEIARQVVLDHSLPEGTRSLALDRAITSDATWVGEFIAALLKDKEFNDQRTVLIHRLSLHEAPSQVKLDSIRPEIDLALSGRPIGLHVAECIASGHDASSASLLLHVYESNRLGRASVLTALTSNLRCASDVVENLNLLRHGLQDQDSNVVCAGLRACEQAIHVIRPSLNDSPSTDLPVQILQAIRAVPDLDPAVCTERARVLQVIGAHEGREPSPTK